MAKAKSKGRMLRRDISKSKKIASLSERSAVLFFMLIPHLNSFGKMNGSPYFVKGEVVPLLKYFTIQTIEKCLEEITNKTSLKWFEKDGLSFIHSTNWQEHQDLREDRMGNDDMPDYSRTTPGILHPEVEVEVEVEVKEEGEGNLGATPPKPPAPVKTKYLDFVYLLPEEHNKLLAKYGSEIASAWIDRVNRYAHKIGEKKFKKKYSSHYHVILEWDEKDGGKPNANGKDNRSFHDRAVEQNQRAKQEARALLGVHRGSGGLGNRPDQGAIDRERAGAIHGEFERVPELETS